MREKEEGEIREKARLTAPRSFRTSEEDYTMEMYRHCLGEAWERRTFVEIALEDEGHEKRSETGSASSGSFAPGSAGSRYRGSRVGP